MITLGVRRMPPLMIDSASSSAAERPVSDLLEERVRAAVGGDQQAADDLAVAVEALAHGHAMLLIDGDFGSGQQAVEQAAVRGAHPTGGRERRPRCRCMTRGRASGTWSTERRHLP